MKNVVRSQSLKFFGFCPCLTVRLDPEECDKDDKREEDDEADEEVPDQLRSFLGCTLSDLHSLCQMSCETHLFWLGNRWKS